MVAKQQLFISVILADVRIRSVEQILIGVQLVFQERFVEFLLNQALTLAGVLPIWEADLLHDLIDVGNDAFDNDVGVLILGFGEEFGERLLGPVTLFFRICFLFCCGLK
jgi:hypothetical protein